MPAKLQLHASRRSHLRPNQNSVVLCPKFPLHKDNNYRNVDLGGPPLFLKVDNWEGFSPSSLPCVYRIRVGAKLIDTDMPYNQSSKFSVC